MYSFKFKWNTKMPVVEAKCKMNLGSFFYNNISRGVMFYTYISDSLSIWEYCDNITATDDGKIVKCERYNDCVTMNIYTLSEYSALISNKKDAKLQVRLIKTVLEGLVFKNVVNPLMRDRQ
ncbi:MAG: hypothetical protein LBV16_05990 [Elusimicrobiota bacterium]|jgi:hypothetical protein|nr:hypothetical protein [Elusimicrobiota bacterium]